MSASIIRRARWPWPGRCAVCGGWGWLKAWDADLQGRFCTDCFDPVVDAEAALASQGLVCPAHAAAARRRRLRRLNAGAWPRWATPGAG